jgi:uncharacterized membrane-anchored protein YjiN (DUF445 family)
MKERFGRKADLALIWVLGLFAAAAGLKYLQPNLFISKLFFAVTEAALVGSIADWFAVTALFGKPLGIPWHTALIPRNRERIITAISNAVQNDLLSKDALKMRLENVRLVSLIINWIEERGQQGFKATLEDYTRQAIATIDREAMARFIERVLLGYLAGIRIGPWLGRLLQWSKGNGYNDRIIAYVLTLLAAEVKKDSTQKAIELYLEQTIDSATHTWWQKLVLGVAKLTDTVNVAEAARTLQSELQTLLTAAGNPEHPLRHWVDLRLAKASIVLEQDPEWNNILKTWQRGLVNRLDIQQAIGAVTDDVLEKSADDLPPWLVKQAESVWQGFITDTEKQNWVEARLKEALWRLIETEHNLIATVVQEALQRFSDDDLNSFIQEKTGEDLVWIRINGSVVGALVGVLLFLLSHFIFTPFINPAVRALLH